jgi:amino acid adenylation domain-containing protein
MQELIVEKEVLEGYRLSPQQRRLWTLQQAAGGNSYRALCSVLVEGPLCTGTLKDALRAVVERHEILRTGFHQRPEFRMPLQVINERGVPFRESRDLRECGPREQEAELEELFRREMRHAQDFELDSPLRVTTIALSAERNVLLLNLPALCADARTLLNLQSELSLAYEAALQGRAMQDEVTQYVQFSEWQLELLEDEEAEAGRDYWNERELSAALQPSLPCETGTEPEPVFEPESFAFEVERETLNRLASLLGSYDADRATFLLTCWLTLLYRLTAQPEITIGYAHDGRNYEELHGALGRFARWLPLRAQLSETLGFRELLRQVARDSSDAGRWQDFFLLDDETDARGEEAFFAFGFEFEERPASYVAAGLTFTTLKQYVCEERFRLSLACVGRGQELSLELRYDPSLFERNDVARLAEEFQALLSSAVEAPEAAVAELNILGETERGQVIHGFNQTRADYPTGLCLHELFQEQAARTPENTAVEFEEQQLTYAELNERANRLAHQLRGMGVGPDVLVGVLMERSLEMAVGLLAILKAGGAYLPLDPEYPAERLRFMLEDSGAHVLLTQERLRSSLSETRAQIVCLDNCCELAAGDERGNPFVKVATDNLAYVIYTSGSTGRPKGAMVHHGGVVNCLRWMQETYRLDQTDKFMLKTSLNFDPSVWELFWPLWVGATVRVARPGGQLDNAYLIEEIRAHGVTSIYFVPSMLRVFLDERGVEDCRSLKRVICGGEALPLETMTRFFETLPAELHHSYGPTETSIAATEWTCEPRTARRIVPMGYPLGNTQSYILDQSLRPVPIGVTGELYIGGAGLGRGYLHRAPLTAEKFVPDHLGGESGARLYRTGDLARFLRDGSIEFAGRVDHQVKIRGFRIELGEIEAALRRHSDVEETIVIASEAATGEKRLVAYVVGAAQGLPSAQELRAHLKERLPEYMVPSAFVTLKALPLMHNGKVDRRQLPEPEQTRSETEPQFVAPRTHVEEMLADIWTEILRIERVGINDNFFELGGHSLLATQLVSRVRKLFRVELPLRTLFETPTVAGMAATVQMLMRDEQARQQPPILPTPRHSELPLSFAQQRLWFLDQLQPGSPFYNLFSAVRMQGELDLNALTESFGELVRRHEALRTVFADVDGKPVQVIMPARKLSLELRDLRGLAEDEREAEAMRLAAEDVQRPFDLSRGPLMRVGLLQLGEQEHILLLCIHHIISDGWSTRVLIRELVTLYDNFSSGRPSPLAELGIQYADFARWQREWLQGDVLLTQLEYWRGQLAGAPAVLEFPTDRPRPAVQTFRGARESLVFPKELAEAVQVLSRREGVTQFMTLLAAFKVLLGRYSGQADIVVGTPIAGRNQIEIEELIGFFVNTLVLRTDLSGGPSFRELLGRVREASLGAAAHQDLPFEKLVEELQPERDLSRSPLFQVMFALQNVPKDEFELKTLTLSPIEADSGTAKFDLTMFFHPTEDGLLGILEYNTDLFDAETARRMLAHYEVLLRGVVADPEQRISSLPLLTEPERQQMLELWNDTAAPYPHDACFQQLFEAQVAHTPDAIAVSDDHEQLSYSELNGRANRLARFLLAQGVGAESVVAVLERRGVSLLTAMLAIFKAGGTYLPLDPRHPAPRLAQVLTQSRALLVLAGEEFEEAVSQAVEQMATGCVVPVHQLGRAIEQAGDTQNLGLQSEPQNLAYVIYTSGSTGVPKGAMIEQRGMINHLFIKVRDLGLGPADVLAQTASQCFDISIWQFLSPLLVGGRVRIFDDEVAVDPVGLLSALELEGVTIAETVPSMLHALLDEIEKNSPARTEASARIGSGAAPTGETSGETSGETLAALRWMVVTGEALGPELCRDWKRLMGDRIRLLNAYGPTECSDDVTHYEVRESPAEHVVRMPIGRALGNTRLYILDREMGLAPVGVSGELYVGGAGVGRGYLYNARRTCESFVPDPFTKTGGERLYRTGDLCRYRPNGQIEFLGRIDHQVKVRGFRIELGEIEAALAQHPEVAEVAVAVHDNGAGDKRLVAYVVGTTAPRDDAHEASTETPRGQESNGRADLREYLKQRLPEYMVPQAFIMLEALPLTPNGKLDRRALPAPDYAQQVWEKSYLPPRDETEKSVAGIWSEVLGLERVGVEDNFFSIGGHSLLATQVISRVRQQFQIELPLRALFESPTVSELARVITRTREQQRGAQPVTPAIVARGRRGKNLEQLLAQVQGLSEAEVQQALHAKRDSRQDAS